MNLPKAYIKGFGKAVKSPRLIFILYLSNVLTALLIALPFRGYLQRSFGRSKLFENLLDGFDSTAFSNLLYYNKDGLLSILNSVGWFMLAYFFLSIFLGGGIIRILNRDKYSNAHFFSGATFNFFRFLGLSLMFLLVQIALAIAIYVPLGFIIDGLQDKLASEIVFYYWIGGAVLLHLLLFLLISMIGDYSKFYLEITNSFNIFKGFWKGIKYVFTHFAKTYFLYLFLLFLPAVVMYVYLYFEKDIKMAMGVGILIVFAMQQGFVLLRMFLRVWILASEFKMYDDDTKDTDTADRSKAPTEPEAIRPAVNYAPPAVVNTPDNEAYDDDEEYDEDDIENSTTDTKDYVIDFDSTFSDNNEIEADEKSLTEDEIIKKVSYEDQQELWLKSKNEDKISRHADEVYDEETYEEPVENSVCAFAEDDTEEHAEGDVSVEEIIEEEDEFASERVRQNVTNGILESQIGVEDDDE